MEWVSRRIENYLQLRAPLKWMNIILISFLHITSVYALFFAVPKAKWSTLLWNYGIHLIAGFFVTLGTHRLWCHNSYKATIPLRFALMMGHIFCGLYSIMRFVRDHRIHHKYTETDCDPHNINRGFFFSHVGWWLIQRLPECKEKGKKVDLSDVWADPVVRFQEKYYIQIYLFCNIFLPVLIPYFFFGEDFVRSLLIGYFLRICIMLNIIWSLNSVSHSIGSKSYNNKISAVQNGTVTFLTVGEGWHNYHHVFPWDCRIGEFTSEFQLASMLLQVFSWLGLAYDLKFASPELVAKAKKRCAKGADFYEYPDPYLQAKVTPNNEVNIDNVNNKIN